MNRFVAFLMSSTIVFTSAKALANIDYSIRGTADSITMYTNSSGQSYSGMFNLNFTQTNAKVPFYWGGSACSNFTSPSSVQIEMMTQAVIFKKNIVVSSGRQGSINCLLGFSIEN